MECAIIFLSLIALGYAVPLTSGKFSQSNKFIKLHGDDTISIYGSQGKKVIISRVQGSPGQRDVEIFMEDKSGPEDRKKKIWFNDQGDTDQDDFDSQNEQTEADILVKIFQNHQGPTDDDTFDEILQKIRHCVQTGKVDETVLYILKTFDSDEDQDSDETDSDTSLEDTLQQKLQKIQQLQKLLKHSASGHKTTDLEQFVRENPVFINKLVRQSLADMDQDDLVYMNDLLQKQKQQVLNERGQQEPDTWRHKQIQIAINRLLQNQHGRQHVPGGFENLVKQQQQLLQIEQGNPSSRNGHNQGQSIWEDLFDRKVDQLERKQELFRKLILNQFNSGEDQEVNQGVIGGRKFVGKEMAPESFEDEQDVQDWSSSQDQTDQDQDSIHALQDQLQQENAWHQQRYFKYLTNPRDRSLNYQHRVFFVDPIRY